MRGILVDSNIILDVFLDEPNWAEWSESKLENWSNEGKSGFCITLWPLLRSLCVISQNVVGFGQFSWLLMQTSLSKAF
jgi:hypothetical protein